MPIHFNAERMECAAQAHALWWKGELDRPLMKVTIADAYDHLVCRHTVHFAALTAAPDIACTDHHAQFHTGGSDLYQRFGHMINNPMVKKLAVFPQHFTAEFQENPLIIHGASILSYFKKAGGLLSRLHRANYFLVISAISAARLDSFFSMPSPRS